MTTKYLKLGDFYWRKESRTLFNKNVNAENKYSEAGILTHKQYALLCCLVDAHPAVLNNDEIVAKVWNTQHISAESLPQLIIRTRQVLNDKSKNILTNEPGIGYKLNFAIEDNPQTVINISECEPLCAVDPVQPMHTIAASSVPTRANQPWGLIITAVLIGLMLFQMVQLSSAIYYKRAFESLGLSAPYPYISQQDNKTIVTIENHECIYNQDQQLLRCK